ncbi:M66 family metalloprotease [Photobacterium kishitanii]|uniref:Glycosyl transferase n=1 Tax=Photobacterium kishitanii TaxID=318456 RepID=A0A2T3KK82_9GAMM|nr:M66 family metalloprotease [Photobacterium kishitanii]PSU99983.1 glycosyl transferase [Photobacterium kishitanii]
MKINKLTLLMTAMLSCSSAAAQSPLPLQQVGQMTFDRLEDLKQQADRGEGTFNRDGENYLNYQGREYLLNHENYPRFPFLANGGDDSAYRHVIDFIDDSWEFMMYNGGFYLMSKEFGVYNSDESGCFIEYIPAARGSQHDDGSYSWESNMSQNVVTTDCKGITAPVLNEFIVSSLSDQGVTFNWAGQQAQDTVTVTLSNINDIEDVQVFNKSSSGFFIGTLTPNTSYQVEVTNCNLLSCTTPIKQTFTTLPARLGFADHAPTINHLSGDLAAQLSFAQTGTTTAPFGNEEAGNPDLVINRAAMLLLNPEDTNINQLWVEVYLDGVLQVREAMLPPSALATTDQPNNGRTKVIYSHRTWSLPLQWDWIKPGISLRFTDSKGNIGELAQSNVVFAGAPELVIQNIDIGMLMEPRNRNTMIQQMATLAADYFQKIPVSKLIMADYTAAHFPKITMPNGKVYTERSDGNGGWHSGDMREAIGKALVSTGINNANFGITDTAGYSQSYNRRFNHITAHTNNGVYANGVVNHGGSGGGGIVTLTDTTGNEWSHELGHNYGLSHYPAQSSSHDEESGWGWDAVYNRFIGNLNWTSSAYTNSVGGETIPPFANDFGYLKDAQAGGYSQGLVSRYTLHHPKMNRRASNWFNSTNVLDSNSSTGYSRWDQSLQRYVEANVDYAAPQQQGVPVITLLGVYDPTAQNPSQIYPLVYSNYGNIFNQPTPPAPDYQIEGWHSVDQLTDEQQTTNRWQTLIINGEVNRMCQFEYTANNGDTANIIGAVNDAEQRCEATNDMFWLSNNNREQLVSAPQQYSIASIYGEGALTYTPTPEIGEVAVCSIDSGNIAHEGAGFLRDGYCMQVDGMKHANGNIWRYAANRPTTIKPTYQSQRQCQLTLTDTQGDIRTISLANSRYSTNQSNKFHVNIPAEQHPSKMELSCTDINGKTILDTQFPEYNPAIESLAGPIILGQEFGYDALQSAIPEGWFTHPEQNFNPNELSARDHSFLAYMPVNGEKRYVCRFEILMNNAPQTLHGYVEQVSNNQYRCTGGNEITLRQNGTETIVESDVNQFEWLSVNDSANVGEKAKAYKDSDEALCVVTRSGFYGAGFVNSKSQCTQIPEIYWSNGNQWTFSSGHGGYTVR